MTGLFNPAGWFCALLMGLTVFTAQRVDSQVRTFPIYTVTQKGTFGGYHEASQRVIYHASTEISFSPSWHSTYSFLYRRSGVEYRDRFSYKQNQFTGSLSRLFPIGTGFFWLRPDISYIASNSDSTNENLTGFGEVGYMSGGGRVGMSLGGFYSKYIDLRSFGGSTLLWAKFSGGEMLSARVNLLSFSGGSQDREKFVSGKVAVYYPVTSRTAFLFSASAGRRSLFYDSDLKLVYDTRDINLGGGNWTVFFYPSTSLMVFLDGTVESYEASTGEKYRVGYLTVGGSVSF